MAKRRLPFDPKSFLAKVGEGRTISKYRKDQVVFSQGDLADAVFCIQKGRVKVTVVSDQGKEAKRPSSHFSEPTSSAARAAWPGSRGA
jgi:CRP/FNR family transcriptional regulator, cyclic AMP receptor protein